MSILHLPCKVLCEVSLYSYIYSTLYLYLIQWCLLYFYITVLCSYSLFCIYWLNNSTATLEFSLNYLVLKDSTIVCELWFWVCVLIWRWAVSLNRFDFNLNAFIWKKGKCVSFLLRVAKICCLKTKNNRLCRNRNLRKWT